MVYRVYDFDDLVHLGKEAGGGDDSRHALETALNIAEEDGWRLLHITDQRRVWDEEGQPAGTEENMFILHKPDENAEERTVDAPNRASDGLTTSS